MKLLQKRQRNSREDGRGGGLARRDAGTGGIARRPDDRQQFDRALDLLRREFDRDPLTALDAAFRQLGSLAEWPAVDIAEDDKAVTLRVDAPGLDPKDISIEVSGNQLTIRGQREDEWSENERGVRLRERVSGNFARTLTLPSYVDPGKIDARSKNGTLTITIPKVEGKGPTRVPVSAS
jgi:HSP20 family protein